MEASKQYHGSMQAAVEVTSRSMEHAGKQQIIATELLYKSCIQAKQNNAHV